MKLVQILLGIGVVEREHADRSPDRDRRGARLASDALRRRVGSDELGVSRFNLAQQRDEVVEVAIGHDGIVEHVVAVVVGGDLVNELAVTLRRGHPA